MNVVLLSTKQLINHKSIGHRLAPPRESEREIERSQLFNNTVVTRKLITQGRSRFSRSRTLTLLLHLLVNGDKRVYEAYSWIIPFKAHHKPQSELKVNAICVRDLYKYVRVLLVDIYP